MFLGALQIWSRRGAEKEEVVVMIKKKVNSAGWVQILEDTVCVSLSAEKDINPSLLSPN